MGGGSVVAQLNPNGNFYWLHLDHLGSGRKMTDSTGALVYRAEFDPYGKLLYEWSSPTNLNTRKFTGYERDAATNLDYAQARRYSSEWGRFTSVDKLGLTGARLTNPKSLNRYSYASGDPVNRVDRNGMEDIPVVVAQTPGGFDVTINGGGTGPVSTMGMYGFSLFGGEQMFMIDDGTVQETPFEGGGGAPAEQNYSQEVADSVANVNSIFQSDNPCSQFFGGKTVATLVLSQLAKLLTPGVVQTKNEQGRLVDSTTIGISMAVPANGIPSGVDGWYYRLPTSATVNTKGPFFNSGNFGGYGSSSAKGRAMAMLHELAHLISNTVMDDGVSRVWQIIDDGGNTETSQKNTEIVKKACKDQIEKLK